MKPLRILEITPNPFLPRQQFWQAQLPQWGASSIEFTQAPSAEQLASGEDILQVMRQQWNTWVKDVDGILLGEAFNPIYHDFFKHIPQQIRAVKRMDMVVKDEKGTWWPHCILRSSLHQMIVQKTPRLDTTKIAYITGSSLTTRVAVGVTVQLGFPKINLVFVQPEQAETLLQELERTYFGVEFSILQDAELTTQKNNGSLLINAAAYDGIPNMIEDLSYLNFLLAEALVIDLNIFPLKNNLIEEVGNVGLPFLRGYEISGATDYEILKLIFPALTVSKADYISAWLKHLESINT